MTVWCNASLSADAYAMLAAGVGEHRLSLDDDRTGNLGSGGISSGMAESDIAFGQPNPEQLLTLASLKWTHLTSAGYTRYDRDDIRHALKRFGTQMSNSSSVYSEPCAQHLFAFMFAQARQIPRSIAAQHGTHSWIFDELRPVTRLMADQSVLILSYGAIARRLVELLKPFPLDVKAVRRQPSGGEEIPVLPIDELDPLLPAADHIVNILPASPSTDRLMNGARFDLLKQGAVFYNVGRGTTVDQPALIGALASGRLAAAYLDVTDPEPLPADDPLWSAPNCVITPHIAGGFANESVGLVKHFLANLKRFESGEPLVDRILQ